MRVCVRAGVDMCICACSCWTGLTSTSFAPLTCIPYMHPNNYPTDAHPDTPKQTNLQGAIQHTRDPLARAQLVAQVAKKAAAAVAAVGAAGLKCRVVTGGGTGTYRLEAGSGVFTEVQPGEYSFNVFQGPRWDPSSGAGGAQFGGSWLQQWRSTGVKSSIAPCLTQPSRRLLLCW